MTSIYSTDAVVVSNSSASPTARFDAAGVPIQGQLPIKIQTVTATGAMPQVVGKLVIISGAAAITLTAASTANLVGREVTFASDNVNAVAHIVQFPANSIGGASSRVTFAANSAASATFLFRSLTHVVVKALSNAVVS